MKLILFNKPDCSRKVNIVQIISLIYQMEQEFYPYVQVEFKPYNSILPNGGIILQTHKGYIKKDMSFLSNPENLRSLIWNLIPHNYSKYPTNKVLITSSEIKAYKKSQQFPPIPLSHAPPAPPSPSLSPLPPTIRSWSYNTCMNDHIRECNDNYLPSSPLNHICKAEINWLCKNSTGPNNTLERHTKLMHKYRDNLYKKLEQRNFYVDKKLFDEVISVGLFDDSATTAAYKSP